MSKIVVAALLLALSASAGAATLKSCQGIQTSQGFRYAGTYCVDYACTVVTTRIFTSYCPNSI
jgi:hypothetical protein